MPAEPPPDSDLTLSNRYLADQVSDTERMLLEAEMMTNPERVEELEATARFKVGLQRLRENGELDALLSPPPRAYQRWALAAAAVLLLGTVLALRSFNTVTPVLLVASVNELADRSGRLPPLAPIQLISRVRADVGRIVVRLPRERQALKLRIFPTAELQPPLAIKLLGAKGTVLGQVLVRDFENDGFVTVFLDSATIEPGDYVLQLRAAAEDQRVSSGTPADAKPQSEEFPFAILPAPR